MCTDVQSVETDPKVAKVTSRKVKTHQRRPRSRNSSYRLEVEMAKCPEGQKHVNYKGNDMHATKNILFEPLEMWSREVTFWRVVEVLGGFKDVAAVATARIESHQHSWLHKANTCAIMQQATKRLTRAARATHRPSSALLWSPLDADAQDAYSKLKMSVKCEKAK